MINIHNYEKNNNSFGNYWGVINTFMVGSIFSEAVRAGKNKIKKMSGARNFEKRCEQCGKLVHIQEYFLTGGLGAKEKEEASCPNCHSLLYKAMTEGGFRTSLIEENSINNKK
ncbi:MAG: hypothetical protein LBN93_01905 [Candidatus Symbiothrix sp.]|nr:hypothetical protein [Candidatus Symbiothrix sp.]